MPETKIPQFDMESPAAGLMREKLGPQGVAMLEDQLSLWEELNARPLYSPLREALKTGNTRLPKGALLHGSMHASYDPDIITSIAEKGIVSGELLGAFEDAETHGCADFFRVPEHTTIAGYMDFAKKPKHIGNLIASRGERLLTRGMAFIVDPQAEGMDKLLVRDGYTDPDMQAFIALPHGRTAEDTAAILGGVPKGAIAGILVDDKSLAQGNVLEHLKAQFPDTPVIDHEGKLRSL